MFASSRGALERRLVPFVFFLGGSCASFSLSDDDSSLLDSSSTLLAIVFDEKLCE